jgi:hypothetical protein
MSKKSKRASPVTRPGLSLVGVRERTQQGGRQVNGRHPEHPELTPVQLAAIARESWQMRDPRHDNALRLMCEARAELAQVLGVPLDPEQDVCRFCDVAEAESRKTQGVEQAALLALDMIGRAVADLMRSDELLMQFVEATSHHIDALSRTR